MEKKKKRARDLLYVQVSQYFVLEDGTYKPRTKACKSIGRMQSVPPSQPERFHLKIILSNVKGITNFLIYIKLIFFRK